MKTVEVVNTFIEAIGFIFESLTFSKAATGRPFIKQKSETLAEFTSILGIKTPEGKHGSISMSLTKEAAVFVVQAMLGDEPETLEDDTKEITGELLNIFSGDVRRRMSEQGLVYSGGTPIIILGEGRNMEHDTSAPIVVIPFSLPQGFGLVEFGFEVIE